jgi:uncharacterized membrane protein
LRNKAYLRRLGNDLPSWFERGWVTPEGRTAILDHVAADAAGVRRAPLAFAILGALLLGTGVILFFAANWNALPKLAKLVILFGGMWAAYLAAGYALARPDRTASAFGHALLLLGTILFGANINLIAQIYHISGHYPNAILLWSMGALAVAWLARSQPAAVLGLVILTLWSGMEILDFEWRVHWPFVVAWALFLPPILRNTWRFAAGTALLALLAWGVMTYFDWDPLLAHRASDRFALAEASFLVAIALMLAGVTMEWHERFRTLAGIVQRFSIVGALLSLLALTLGREHGDSLWSGGAFAASAGMRVFLLVALAVVVVLGVLVQRRMRSALPSIIARSGLILLAAILVLILASLFIPSSSTPRLVVYIGFNLLYYAVLVWLIYVGYHRGDSFRVNAGFVFFVLGVLLLYSDALWSLMDRSFFFIGGGLLLCAGGYALEAQRRRLVRGLGRREAEGGAA